MSAHASTRVHHTLRRRTLTVTEVEQLTPRMTRVRFASPDLTDFVSASPDDHVKLFFPTSDGATVMRDFTPRAFDRDGQTLAIDFALHDDGPATRWAASVRVGQTLDVGGPRGSLVVQDDFDWYLLVGDEAALPAIGRRVEELRSDVPVTTIVAVRDASEKQTFVTRAAWRPIWICRDVDGADDAETLRAALASQTFPDGDGFVFIAAENGVARALRTYVVEERGHPRAFLKAAAYWKRGVADAHERIED